jgi:DNA modification methylase
MAFTKSREGWEMNKFEPNVESWEIDKIIPYALNSKKHPDSQIDKIASSMVEFGMDVPVVVDGDGVLIKGHGRRLAAIKLGLTHLPVIIRTDLSPAQVKAARIADNRISQSDWDVEFLEAELRQLEEMDFDLELTGFDPSELDAFFAEKTEGLTDPDDVPETPIKPVTMLGDVWLLGKHRLMCGDSLSTNQIEKLLNGEDADMIFTDPPYGVSYKSPSGRGMTARGNYDIIKGDDQPFDPSCLFGWSEMVVAWGANHYAHKLPPSACWLVWDKREGDAVNNNSDCELAWVSQGGSARLFHHKWNGMIKASERNEKRVHPTQKPVALAIWAFDLLDAGKVVLDLFGGSGSTLIACESSDRSARVCELDEKYADVIVKRWQDFTGKEATLDGAGMTFDEVAESRVAQELSKSNSVVEKDYAE